MGVGFPDDILNGDGTGDGEGTIVGEATWEVLITTSGDGIPDDWN